MPRNPKDSTILVDDEDQPTSRMGLRIPPFWPEDPELWFAQLEGQFALSSITDDNTKYAYVLSRIEPKQAREVKDVITQPPATRRYEAIKKALIQRLTDSQAQKIKQLLEHEELGDRKPSQFLRHLTTLAGTTVSDELLRTLWLGRLPPQMQAILATRTEDELSSVAEQADRIHEVSNRTLVAAIGQQTAATQAANPWTAQIEMLTKQVAALTTQMTRFMKQRNTRGSTRERSRSRSRNYQRTSKQEGICYYHKRFGAEARKCTQPCTYKKPKNEESSH
ncbi:uncharacterized protein [Polyergus mexicanus]|uniref:uncharacterized protein n=1 Tax=Polyergus mexicanus TaxID=615972 RepID=UPI0038B5D14F